MEQEWAVCFNPITWGEVIWKHTEKIRVMVGSSVRDFRASAVMLFESKADAQKCYQETLDLNDRMKTGI